MNLYNKFEKTITPHSDLLLLTWVFLFIFVVPFFPSDFHLILANILFSFVFFTSIFVLQTNRTTTFYVALVAFATEWISSLLQWPITSYISLITNIIFFQLIVIKLIIQIARSKTADARTILQCINVYFLMGLMFTTWIAIAMQHNPASFHFPVDAPTISDFVYFTFVTMTTLGYGEVVPVQPFAKSISILISVSGQIYLAVILAMLVGKYASHESSK